jgi:multiple sugar transport system substrate-binding protein
LTDADAVRIVLESAYQAASEKRLGRGTPSPRIQEIIVNNILSKTKIRLAAAVLLTGTVAACGSSGTQGGGATTDANPASVTGTLRVLVPSYPASNEGKAALQKVVDEFHKTYPKVQVQPDFATFDTLNEKISTSIAGGQPYDVYVSGVGWIPPFASKNLYADLSKYGVTEQKLTSELDPTVLPTLEYKGKIYAVPLVLGPKTLAYSKKAFQAAGLDATKPPTSIEELRADARKLVKRDASGKITQAGFDFWAAPGAYRQDFVTFLGAEGKPLYDNGKPAFNGPEGVSALQTMADMINQDKVTTYGAVSSDGQPLVFTGQAAMGVAGGYIDCAKVGQSRCNDLAFFNLRDKKTAMFSGGQLASISATSQLGGAAYAFVQAMRTPQAEADIAKLNFAIPATKSASSGSAAGGNPASTFAAGALNDAVFEGGSADWLQVRSTFGNELDKTLLGKEDAQSVLNRLAQSSQS